MLAHALLTLTSYARGEHDSENGAIQSRSMGVGVCLTSCSTHVENYVYTGEGGGREEEEREGVPQGGQHGYGQQFLESSGGEEEEGDGGGRGSRRDGRGERGLVLHENSLYCGSDEDGGGSGSGSGSGSGGGGGGGYGGLGLEEEDEEEELEIDEDYGESEEEEERRDEVRSWALFVLEIMVTKPWTNPRHYHIVSSYDTRF